MNRVILLGRMVRDSEVRYTQAAEPLAVCRFTVAVDRPFSKNRQEGEPTVDFINCVCFGKRGESINKYFHKGNRIALQGRLQVSNYTDQQGNKRYSAAVIVEDFEFVELKTTEKNVDNSPGDNSSSYSDYVPVEIPDNEDLPF